MIGITFSHSAEVGANGVRRENILPGGETIDGTSMLIPGSLLALIPPTIFMTALQRFRKTGVTLGAVK